MIIETTRHSINVIIKHDDYMNYKFLDGKRDIIGTYNCTLLNKKFLIERSKFYSTLFGLHGNSIVGVEKIELGFLMNNQVCTFKDSHIIRYDVINGNIFCDTFDCGTIKIKYSDNTLLYNNYKIHIMLGNEIYLKCLTQQNILFEYYITAGGVTDNWGYEVELYFCDKLIPNVDHFIDVIGQIIGVSNPIMKWL